MSIDEFKGTAQPWKACMARGESGISIDAIDGSHMRDAFACGDKVKTAEVVNECFDDWAADLADAAISKALGGSQ